ncbi:MAG: DUF4280 domain-containing protein [Polyangiales bacterium]
MPKLVVHGAVLQCSMGAAPASLTVLPTNLVDGDTKPVATVMDFAPMTNVAPFGMCRSPANPQVAAATAAAMGVLTPQPCVPVLTAPWSPGSPVVTIGSFRALTDDSQCACAWAGTVSVTQPGATEFIAE